MKVTLRTTTAIRLVTDKRSEPYAIPAGRSASMLAIVRFSANKIRRIVDAARSHIPRHLRVGTDGTRPGHHAGRNPGGNDLLRGRAFLDPILKRGHQVQRIGPSRGGS